MKYKKILFVCTGNTCRSPMAEAALRAELKKRKISYYTVRSAGLSARAGSTLNPLAAQVLSEEKIPVLKSFQPRRLTKKMLEESYAVVCMTADQHRALAGHLNVTSFPAMFGEEIADPYGQGLEAYRAAFRQIRAHLADVIRILRLEEEQPSAPKNQKSSAKRKK